MLTTLLFYTFILSTSAFVPSPKIKTFRYVGSTKPFENFDPLNILENKSENRIKFTREAELQHGRLAILGTLSIPLLEHLDKHSSVLGINYLSSLDLYHQAPFWLGISSYEAIRMERGWKNPFSTNTTFNLLEDYQPGNLGNYDMSKIDDSLLNKELNNGRLAMIAFIGILVQEVVTGQPIF
tara:strand:+ start:11134 stop:11679 length:546 start_codon:yes stop_codon:yes gene_type:complete